MVRKEFQKYVRRKDRRREPQDLREMIRISFYFVYKIRETNTVLNTDRVLNSPYMYV